MDKHNRSSQSSDEQNLDHNNPPQPLKITTLFQDSQLIYRSQYLSQADLVKQYSSIANNLNNRKRSSNIDASQNFKQSLTNKKNPPLPKLGSKKHSSESLKRKPPQASPNKKVHSTEIPIFANQILESQIEHSESQQIEGNRYQEYRKKDENNVEKNDGNQIIATEHNLQNIENKLQFTNSVKNLQQEMEEQNVQQAQQLQQQLKTLKKQYITYKQQKQAQQKAVKTQALQKLKQTQTKLHKFQHKNTQIVTEILTENIKQIKQQLVDPYNVQNKNNIKKLKKNMINKLQKSVFDCIDFENKDYWSSNKQTYINTEQKIIEDIQKIRNKFTKKAADYQNSLQYLLLQFTQDTTQIQKQIKYYKQVQKSQQQKIVKKIKILQCQFQDNFIKQKQQENKMYNNIEKLIETMHDKFFRDCSSSSEEKQL